MPEDRQNEGLINELSVKFNLTLGVLNKATQSIIVKNKLKHNIANALIHKYSIKTASSRQEVNNLSGGNKQKAVIGRITAVEPKVFLLDEPTRGIDIEAKAAILDIIKNKLCENASVIITEPGLEDIMKICDRILVISKGRIITEIRRNEFQENNIYSYMQGG